MTPRDPISHGKPPFTVPKVEDLADRGPRGCDDITPAVLCFIAGAVAFVVVLAACGVLP